MHHPTHSVSDDPLLPHPTLFILPSLLVAVAPHRHRFAVGRGAASGRTRAYLRHGQFHRDYRHLRRLRGRRTEVGREPRACQSGELANNSALSEHRITGSPTHRPTATATGPCAADGTAEQDDGLGPEASAPGKGADRRGGQGQGWGAASKRLAGIAEAKHRRELLEFCRSAATLLAEHKPEASAEGVPIAREGEPPVEFIQ